MSTSTTAGPKKPLDPDEFFQHTRMSLGDHLDELSGALWRCAYGLGIAVFIGFFFAKGALQIIAYPVEGALTDFYEKRLAEKHKEFESGAKPLVDADHFQSVPLQFSRKELLQKIGLDSSNLSPDDPKRQELVKLGLDADKIEPTDYVTVKAGIPPVQMQFLMDGANRLVSSPPTLKSLSPTEAFVIWLKMGFYLGIVLSSPWIFYQIWMFVAAGLYPNEKKYIHLYLPISLGLFLAGVLLCEFVALPMGLSYLLAFNKWLGIEPDLRLSEWLSFALLMPLVFGIAFQTPMVMLFLERLGIFTVETYLKSWRMAIFVIVAISALLSVSPDPSSVAVLAIPMLLLYYVGILLCKVMPRGASLLGDPSEEETVEV